MVGELTFDDPGNQPGPPPLPIVVGGGSPINAVTPSGKGELYIDLVAGGLWIAVGVTSADWLRVGGITAAPGLGVSTQGGDLVLEGDTSAAMRSSANAVIRVTGASPQIIAGPGGAVTLAADAGAGVQVLDDGAGHVELGFYGATAVGQRGAIPDPAGGAVQDAEARTAIVTVLQLLADLGLTA